MSAGNFPHVEYISVSVCLYVFMCGRAQSKIAHVCACNILYDDINKNKSNSKKIIKCYCFLISSCVIRVCVCAVSYTHLTLPTNREV